MACLGSLGHQKTNTEEPPVKPEHHTGRLSRASAGEFTAVHLAKRPLPALLPRVVWRLVSLCGSLRGGMRRGVFSSGSVGNGALQPGETRSSDRVDRNYVPRFVVAAVVYSRAN